MAPFHFVSSAGLVVAAVLAAADQPPVRPWMNRADPPQVRAKRLVAEMTFTEMTNLFHGSCNGYTGNVCANARLGIPEIKMNDGPQGFRGPASTSTAFPAAITIAAAWDVNVTHAWGLAMGDEFYRKGANVQLGPGLCMARVPRNGRNFEYVSGEDPFLGMRNAAAVVTGIQSQGVVANAKHWVNNNAETDRHYISENVDERTQFELYYPPFEGAIQAGLGSVMCSYNLICVGCELGQIGNWSCENDATLRVDLKERLGFEGWVMSDWTATHSTSIGRGLDMEMPGAGHMNNRSIAALVASGEIPQVMVADSAYRILWPLFAVGAFDSKSTGTAKTDVRTPANTAAAIKFATEATVLLKNDGVLPVPRTAKTIAVIGAQAARPAVVGGGSGTVFTADVSSPLAAIKARFGILPPPPPTPPAPPPPGKQLVVGARCDPTDKGQSGWSYDSKTQLIKHGDDCLTTTQLRQPMFLAPCGRGSKANLQTFAYDEAAQTMKVVGGPFEACLQMGGPTEKGGHGGKVDVYTCLAGSGSQAFAIDATDGVIKDNGGTVCMAAWDTHGRPSHAHGDNAAPELDSTECGNQGVCINYSSGADVANATATARAADVVLMFAAADSEEGIDRGSLNLGSQDALIAAVALDSGHKTAVVVVTPGAILTDWRDNVSAVLTPFMPGQGYGDAITAVLFGDHNPSGRLPITFPAVANEENMTIQQWPGVHKANLSSTCTSWHDTGSCSAIYSERLNVGYRWYAANPDVVPAYPFGHGIGFTTFDYSGLKIAGRTVTCVVKNNGTVAGAEVPQLYLRFPASAGEPPKQLKGYQKITLGVQEAATVTFELDDRSFSIWDVVSHSWKVVPGAYGVMVGASSGDIRLSGSMSP